MINRDNAWRLVKLIRSLPEQWGSPGTKERADMLQRIADDALQAISSEIDDIEVAVRAVIPEAKHIDIEIDYHKEALAKPANGQT